MKQLVDAFENAVRDHQAAANPYAYSTAYQEARAKLLAAVEQPTWLDRCAWEAMGGALSNPKLGVVTCSKLAEEAYKVADAMLAEKVKREGGAQ